MADRTQAHQALVAEIRWHVGNQADCLLWVNTSGKARPMGSQRVISFGLGDSGGDLVGIGPGGVHIELEIKTGGASQTKGQVMRGALVARYGGVYTVVRSVEDARAVITSMRPKLAAANDT